MKWGQAEECRDHFARSSPARGTWVEIGLQENHSFAPSTSSPARGTWVEIQLDSVGKVVVCVSSPARGTWVEMATLTPNPVNTGVVSRTGDVG